MVLAALKTQQEFEEFVKPLKLSVLHFYAEWAPQCEQMNEAMQELSKLPEFRDVQFAKILAEEVPEISLRHKVTAVPTFILIVQNKEVDRVDGANTGNLKKKITQCLQDVREPLVSVHALPESSKADLETRLKKLINAAPVMLFMKGSSFEPRCKFSRAIVDILNSYNASYNTFDILNNEEVRQGLKEFSNWPTYPQLYINGELIGGLDIVKELQQSGELESMLPKKLSLEERLKGLINKAPVMIFMKGNPGQPKCGFSRTLMEIMRGTGVSFETFDILEDEEVRQGLKEFSKWPTYPQLYVKGELIGGLDIIKELKDSGELMDALKG
ncbi:Glutaredoxin-3 [Frankliniella fusca]|uniref:Glutaredoxin-3 n=1 Tax=Frankliniella fusca TaxID=407009 RepID=A0AAE1LU12_9NEOP|nr:Glutaredoxin-3 [Frankliniella fusca]